MGLEAKRKEKEKLEGYLEQKAECELVPIRLATCTHITEYIAKLRLLNFDEHQREKAIKNMSAKEQAELQDLIKQREEQKRKYAEAHEIKRNLEDEKNKLQIKIDSALHAKERLKESLNDYLDAHNEVQGEKQKSEITIHRDKITTAQQRLDKIKVDQENYKQSLEKKLTSFAEIFDLLVKYVLGDSFSGKAFEYQGKWKVSILDRGRSAGQTYLTIGNILFDMAAALFTQDQEGTHPSFFIFDSPRETDMDDATYARFVNAVNNLSSLRDGFHIPFQCILTSTTPPPDKLKDTIRLELAAYPHEHLLFKRTLQRDSLFL